MKTSPRIPCGGIIMPFFWMRQLTECAYREKNDIEDLTKAVISCKYGSTKKEATCAHKARRGVKSLRQIKK
jgi:hypothetical protein